MFGLKMNFRNLNKSRQTGNSGRDEKNNVFLLFLSKYFFFFFATESNSCLRFAKAVEAKKCRLLIICILI